MSDNQNEQGQQIAVQIQKEQDRAKQARLANLEKARAALREKRQPQQSPFSVQPLATDLTPVRNAPIYAGDLENEEILHQYYPRANVQPIPSAFDGAKSILGSVVISGAVALLVKGFTVLIQSYYERNYMSNNVPDPAVERETIPTPVDKFQGQSIFR